MNDVIHQQRVRDYRSHLKDRLRDSDATLRDTQWNLRDVTRKNSDAQANVDFAKAELAAFDARHAEAIARDHVLSAEIECESRT